MSILEETEQILEEREVSKPAILGAPYDLSPENQESQEDLKDKFFHSEEDTHVNSGLISDPIEQVAAFILDFQRRLDRIEDNLSKLFKEIGHEHTWTKITGE